MISSPLLPGLQHNSIVRRRPDSVHQSHSTFYLILGSEFEFNKAILTLATQGFLLQASGSTILSIPDVTPWLRPLTHPMA